jgi:hypothetical protein
MSIEKRWDIVVQWYRGEISDKDFFSCFWGDMKKKPEEHIFPTWEETIARKPLQSFSLDELEAAHKFLAWSENEFCFDDDKVEKIMEDIQSLIWSKKNK